MVCLYNEFYVPLYRNYLYRKQQVNVENIVLSEIRTMSMCSKIPFTGSIYTWIYNLMVEKNRALLLGG